MCKYRCLVTLKTLCYNNKTLGLKGSFCIERILTENGFG